VPSCWFPFQCTADCCNKSVPFGPHNTLTLYSPSILTSGMVLFTSFFLPLSLLFNSCLLYLSLNFFLLSPSPLLFGGSLLFRAIILGMAGTSQRPSENLRMSTREAGSPLWGVGTGERERERERERESEREREIKRE